MQEIICQKVDSTGPLLGETLYGLIIVNNLLPYILSGPLQEVQLYSQLFLGRTPWGPAVGVCLREMSVLQRVK